MGAALKMSAASTGNGAGDDARGTEAADSSAAKLPASKKALARLAQASDWHNEVQVLVASSARNAWRVAAVGAFMGVLGMGYGLFEAMQPKPLPVVLTLDTVSGETTVLPKLDGQAVPQVVALDHHNAAVYVRAREGYNYSMLGRDYDQVARMSTPETWTPYAKKFSGPEAMHEKLVDKELHRITVISVRLASGYVPGKAGEALVTYEREVRNSQLPTPIVTRHIATIRYEYRPAAMKRDVDRTENPFGYVVTAYRTDAEIAPSRVESADPTGKPS